MAYGFIDQHPAFWSLNGVRPRRPEQFLAEQETVISAMQVSMESGLEGRNNSDYYVRHTNYKTVSLESGLEGRNNVGWACLATRMASLNGVRPRRPEQSILGAWDAIHRFWS